MGLVVRLVVAFCSHAAPMGLARIAQDSCTAAAYCLTAINYKVTTGIRGEPCASRALQATTKAFPGAKRQQ
jgi:hypothetical protein